MNPSLNTAEASILKALTIGFDPLNIYGIPDQNVVTTLSEELNLDEVTTHYALKRLSILRLIPKPNSESINPLRDQIKAAIDKWPDLANVDWRGRPYGGRILNLAKHTTGTLTDVEAALVSLLKEVTVQ